MLIISVRRGGGEYLGEADFGRIADVERAVAADDAGGPPDQRLGQRRVDDARPGIDDRVLQDRPLDDTAGGDGDVRPDDRLAQLGGRVDIDRWNDEDLRAAGGPSRIWAPVVEQEAVGLEQRFGRAAVHPDLDRLDAHLQ